MTGPQHAITIRPEAAGDEPVIHSLTEAAFRDMPFSDGDEPDLVDHLRAAGDLTLSLVAEDADRIVGHIAFSPVTISDGTKDWFGIGPVSVRPELHSQGIGGALIRRGIADMRTSGAKGIILLGSPEYYSRFGFEHDPKLTYPGPPPEYFQRLVLDGREPSGIVRYSPAFEN
ncbi:GNAT family N-acetyltransferase [Altererythrobacter lutimaris]|uniref:N-acetyltransferase n=1 Tax=Altererythrobacter lutimaris TaxID=2743979 RepID=A0A850HIB7_9SPHN|nr:N-acetyltransferase [Altererythrobacter lutimaris]NVE95212.1 N-acetyltransferase [Altererythrobacter lutimaris]